MRKLSIFFLLLIFAFSALSQDIKYAREIITKICSDDFHGRGFEKKGDIISAKFLSEELEKIGLKPFGKSYLQEFVIPINTFPGTVSVTLDDKKLINGREFLTDKMSNSGKGTYSIVWLDEIGLKSIREVNLSKSYLVIDTAAIEDKKFNESFFFIKLLNPFKAAGIIELIEKKPSSYQSQIVADCPVIQIQREAINKKNKNITLRIDTKFFKNYKTNNVIGYIQGEIDSFIVVGGHYDHLGRMDDIIFPGANDNGSGVAMCLDLARYYSKPENKPKYSLIFAFFSAEEVGLLGSEFFTQKPPVPLEKIKFMMNLDLIGTGDDGVTVVNGAVLKKEFELLTEFNDKNQYLKEIKARGEAANSDHHFFWQNEVKSFFIYTRGGISEYHNVDDIAKTLPLTAYEGLFRLVRDFINAYE